MYYGVHLYHAKTKIRMETIIIFIGIWSLVTAGYFTYRLLKEAKNYKSKKA